MKNPEDVCWLIEDCSLIEWEAERITKYLDEKEMRYKVFENINHEDKWINLFQDDECVIFYGTLETGARINRKAPWTPSLFCAMGNYKCTNYYPLFHDYFLNSRRYIMLPWGSVLKNYNFLFNCGFGERLFIRPNKGNKVFSGSKIYLDTLELDLEKIKSLSYYGITHDELCVISPNQNIIEEYRLVVSDWKIVTGTQYFPDDENSIVPQIIIEKAEELLNIAKEKNFIPDPVWTLDMVTLDSGAIFPLEIGSLSCAGLYACDMSKVVDVVSMKAAEAWNDVN